MNKKGMVLRQHPQEKEMDLQPRERPQDIAVDNTFKKVQYKVLNIMGPLWLWFKKWIQVVVVPVL